MKRIRIRVGGIELNAELNDTKLAKAILEALPHGVTFFNGSAYWNRRI